MEDLILYEATCSCGRTHTHRVKPGGYSFIICDECDDVLFFKPVYWEEFYKTSKVYCIMKGLEIFIRYDYHDTWSLIDYLYAGGEVKEEDERELKALGWVWESVFDCWSIYI